MLSLLEKTTSNRVCIPNKTKVLNVSVFNMITGTNESKTLKNIYHANVNESLVVKNEMRV